MTWRKTAADRQRDAAVYGSAEYKRNRAAAWKRAGGRCEQLLDNGRRCRSRDRCQVDHILNVAAGGTHHLDNLSVKCFSCHSKKTAQEGKGARRPGRRGHGGGTPQEDPALQARTVW